MRPLVHRNVPTLPHPFEPSGRLVGRSRVEACALCGLGQRGPGSMHPDPAVDVPCPHDPTGTSFYACACEDG